MSLAGGEAPPNTTPGKEFILRTIATKVDNVFYNEIKKIADDNNITISKLLKEALKKITNNDIKNIKTIKTKIETNKRIVYELNRLGQNLNQIAKYANSKKIVDKLVLEELIKIEKYLQGLTDDM
jgi:hypothetical protein